MFKYGDREDEKPRLIDQYISYFKEDDSRRKLTKVTQSLVRRRSNSEDAFFKKKNDRTKSFERGALHRGLIGAEGTADGVIKTSEEKERVAIL